MVSYYKLTLKEFFVISISICFLFQITLQKQFSYFGYFDEIITTILFTSFACKYLISKVSITINEAKVLICIILFVFVGILSSFFAQVQTGFKPILMDVFNCIKVYLMYFGASHFLMGLPNRDKVIKILAKIVRVVVSIAAVCAILNFFVDIGMGDEIRYGIRSFHFIIQGGAGQFALCCYLYMVILNADLQYEPSKKKQKIFFIILTLIVWGATLRSRAFSYIAIFITSYFIIVKQKKFKFKFRFIFMAAPLLYLFCISQFDTYFGNAKTARANFVLVAFSLIKKYFPFGSGFATFGTDAAAVYYSDIYYKYGLNHIFGLFPDNPIFSHDTYWPAILGQFGVIGGLLMVLLIYYTFKAMFSHVRGNKYLFNVVLFVCYVCVFSSIATATFFHFMTVGLFFVCLVCLDNSVPVQNGTYKAENI